MLEIVEATGDQVTRRVTDVRGDLEEGTDVAFDGQVWESDPRAARGVPYREIAFRSELGPMPAWVIDGRGATWAIFVHGHNATRQEGLRVLASLRRAGLPSLLIAYRNDPGAPRSDDGLIHLGATEWRDVESAARWAMGEGARSFVLLGDSMGGAIVSQFVRESRLAARVRALVLNAPVLDWRAVLDLHSDERGLPRLLATTTEWMVCVRIGVDWSAFDQIARAHQFRMPILLFHGTQDKTVPISSSDAFARALPDLVTYHRVARAGHVEAWNVDPPRYERRVRAFL
ncbi:MAG: prolyl oligopeptidase family serine peptidase, partial [Thermoleophilaceae bacterium]|nr:prolyl oligopeptidase family serine peptidase [Thermoleophilaceae bacterium]